MQELLCIRICKYIYVNSSLFVLLDVVGIAKVIFPGELSVYIYNNIIIKHRFLPCAIDHCLIGVLIIQILGLFFSSFPSAICTISFESTPLIIPVIHDILDRKDISLEDKATTILVLCTLVSLTTGSMLYILGRLHLASIVENIPLPVKSGIFAAIGYVCLKYGYEIQYGEVTLHKIRQYSIIHLFLPFVYFFYICSYWL